MLHQIKAPQFYTDLGLQKVLNPLANGKIQGLFKAFECFSSTFQDSLVYSSTFQACANPVDCTLIRALCLLGQEYINN